MDKPAETKPAEAKPARAGRKPPTAQPATAKAAGAGHVIACEKGDALALLLAVVDDDAIDPKLRVRAAVAAAQYQHTKKNDGGKKDERAARARKAGAGKFAPAEAPKLVVNNA